MPLLSGEIVLIKSKDPNVRELSFADRAFYDEDIATLVKLLEDNPYVETLDLMSNNITDKGAKLLAGLENVKSIDLSYNNVNEGILDLITNRNIRYLDLGCNNIKPETAQQVLYQKRNLAHLKLLILKNNGLKDSVISDIYKKIEADRNIAEGVSAYSNLIAFWPKAPLEICRLIVEDYILGGELPKL